MKYIIDADPGIDDAIAIILAYKQKMDIIGFTIGTGNIDKEQTINNLNTIQNILGVNIPMYAGTKENKANMISAEYAHGKDGLGNVFMPIISKNVENISAEEFIINASMKYKNNLTIICLGPLTNLAEAIKKDKSIINRISKIVVMGTSYDKKLEFPYKEFNIKIDSEAAKLVFESNFKRINVITHEIGIKAHIKKHYMNSLKNSNDKINKFIYLISQKYMEFNLDRYNIIGCCMPDPVTIASEIDTSIIKFIPCSIKIKDDLSFVTPCDKSNIYVSDTIDLNKFTDFFENALKK